MKCETDSRLPLKTLALVRCSACMAHFGKNCDGLSRHILGTF
jgi:hypothetical protein